MPKESETDMKVIKPPLYTKLGNEHRNITM